MSKKQGSRSRTCPTPPKTSAGRRGPCDAWFRLSWSRGRSTWIRSIQAFARWTSNGKLVLHGNIKHQFWILGRVFLVSDTAVPHSAKIFFLRKNNSASRIKRISGTQQMWKCKGCRATCQDWFGMTSNASESTDASDAMCCSQLTTGGLGLEVDYRF